MDRGTVEFTRVASSDSMDANDVIKINTEHKTVKLDIDEDPEQQQPDRQQWQSPMQFFLTILGFCVGLGNIWRFPYLCQQNGGGAFVIPFLIMMVLEGMPLVLLELAVGQRFRQGSFGVWNMIHPWLGGIGIGSTVIAVVVGCYYNMIIAWCIYYLVNSLWPTLPWSVCPMEANTFGNISTDPVRECDLSSETQYFWYRQALDISSGINDFGGIKWWMFLCLVVAWIIVYLIIMRGIQSSGKVVYFTALFPYVVLTIFFVRGLTLKGSGAGLAHMFKPKLSELLRPKVWLDAAVQVFYSYGLALGSIVSFGSYNAPGTNCVRDVFLITTCNVFTAIYACAVIFSILGFKAQHLFEKCMGRDIETILHSTDIWSGRAAENITEDEYLDLMTSSNLNASNLILGNCTMQGELDQAAQGTGLAFIVMADVFTMLPGAPFWSVLFFSMLLSLGLGSQIGILEGMIGPLFDIPKFRNVKKPIITGGACFFCFLMGIVFTSGAGEYWLTLFDNYGAMGLTLIGFAEIIAVMYVYGHEKFTQDVEDMTGVRPGFYWQITWRLLAPLLLALILCSSVAFEFASSPTYSAWNKELAKSEKKTFHTWTIVLASLLAVASVVPMVLVAVLRIVGLFPVDQSLYPVPPMRRIDTNASTNPMMDDRNHDIDEDDDRSSDESDDAGIVVDGPSGHVQSSSNGRTSKTKKKSKK